MLRKDIEGLTSRERRVLDDAFHQGTSPRRTRGVILSGSIILVAVVLFVTFGASVVFLAGLTVATVVVAAVEKLVYQQNMESYESLVRKMVNSLESLEGVPLSPSIDASAMPGVNVSDVSREPKTQRVQLTNAELVLQRQN